jgi:hypothetical protein
MHIACQKPPIPWSSGWFSRKRTKDSVATDEGYYGNERGCKLPAEFTGFGEAPPPLLTVVLEDARRLVAVLRGLVAIAVGSFFLIVFI